MSWKGNVKGGAGKGSKGKWVWQEDILQQRNYGGKGGGKGSDTSGGKGDSKQMQQMQSKLNKLEKQLTEAQLAAKTTQAKSEAVLQIGAKVLSNPAEPAEVCLTCPSCGTEHSNPNKFKCRIKTCRAILRPGTVPASALTNPRTPKHPLLTGYFQALLHDVGAKECLKENLKEKEAAPSHDIPVGEDEDMEVDARDVPDDESKRTTAEEMLKNLRLWQADPAVIQAQQRILDNLPKPRTPKATQPIRDVSKLILALSQASEYHEKILQQTAETVAVCEQAIQAAHENLAKAKLIQVESKAKAERELEELRGLIQQKQHETKDVLAPSQAPAPASQDDPDQKLMVQEVQNWLVQQQCPDHIKAFFGKMQMPAEVQPSQPIPEPVASSGAGADLGGANGSHPSAMWEAA